MKIQRYDYNRFAEVLGERGLVDPSTLQHVLQQSLNTGVLFPEILVRENLVADWELSRVAAEVFHLPFLALEIYPPSPLAMEGHDLAFLHQHCLVPLDTWDGLITVSMPAMTPSEVLQTLEEKCGKKVQPVVGTVAGNRNWLIENAPLQQMMPEPAVEAALPGAGDEAEDWSSIFDEGDAAVLMDLDPNAAPAEQPAPQPGAKNEVEGLESLDDLDDLLS